MTGTDGPVLDTGAASLTFSRWNAPPMVIELEPILTFQMLGIGYFHPGWPHGVWKGEAASRDGRPGIGVLEQLAIGDHHPSGLRGLFDGA